MAERQLLLQHAGCSPALQTMVLLATYPFFLDGQALFAAVWHDQPGEAGCFQGYAAR